MQNYTTYTVTINYNDKVTNSINHTFDTRYKLDKAFELSFEKFRKIVVNQADMCAVLRVTKCFYTISITRSIYYEGKIIEKEVIRTVKLKNY